MMGDADEVEKNVPIADTGEEKRESQPKEQERLSKLPIEALLYAVMYGDEWA